MLKSKQKGCTQYRRAMTKITTDLISNSRDLIVPSALECAANSHSRDQKTMNNIS